MCIYIYVCIYIHTHTHTNKHLNSLTATQTPAIPHLGFCRALPWLPAEVLSKPLWGTPGPGPLAAKMADGLGNMVPYRFCSMKTLVKWKLPYVIMVSRLRFMQQRKQRLVYKCPKRACLSVDEVPMSSAALMALRLVLRSGSSYVVKGLPANRRRQF